MDAVSKFNRILALANFNRPAVQLLYELVHVYLERAIPFSRMTFFESGPLDERPDIATDEDTFVRADIDPAYDYRFPGDNGFLYRRIPASVLVGNSDLVPVATDLPVKTSDLLFQINRYLNLQLTVDDIVDEEHYQNDAQFVLKFSPGCYAFQGELALPIDMTGYPSGMRITCDSSPRVGPDGSVRIVAG